MRKWLLTLLSKYHCKLYMNQRLFGTTIGAGQIIDRSKLHLYLNKLQHCGINFYIQKEQLILLDDEGHPSFFAPIMIATLSTCAQLERDNISFRLQSGGSGIYLCRNKNKKKYEKDSFYSTHFL